MSATDFTIDVRDLHFVLFEYLKAQELCQLDGYKDFSKDDFEMIVNEAAKFGKEKFATCNKEGDEVGCIFDNGTVTTPPNFKETFKAYAEAGWLASAGMPEYGGQGLPHVVNTALADIFTGANTALYLTTLLSIGVAHVLEKYGNDFMKDMIIPKLYDGTWGGSMVLTEPSAGSDVGAAKTRAEKVDGEDYYLISGTKIFITAGDHDFCDNIIHLVLARTPGAPAGTKGLSLFVTPKVRFDENGVLGEFNDVQCVGIEHKMGIHGSPTCQLSFGDSGNCRGWILGNEGDGIRVMFNMMNEARIEVGLQGCSLMNAAYQNALAYSKDRIQGSSIKDFKNPDAPRVAIIEHPDVRRQLLTIKAFAEGSRLLLHYTAFCTDMAHHAPEAADRDKYQGFLELLTPICKAYCTDRGVEMTSMAIQVFGGYGYTRDYPVEQYMRDVKIGCIYEGTNSIQAMDLIARKMPMKGGAVFMSYLAELDSVIANVREAETLKHLADGFSGAKDLLAQVAMTLGGWGMQKRLDLATSRATGFLDLMGDVVTAAELLKAALVANDVLTQRLSAAGIDGSDAAALHAHLVDSEESAFYHAKIMTAQFFVNTILPRVHGWAKGILSEDLSHMDVVI